MKSARGIYYDLNETTYIFHFVFENGDGNDSYTLYFSSAYLMDKFKYKFNLYVKELNDKLKSIYLVNIDTSLLAIITLYSKIEKRGFKVVINDIEYSGLNDFNLHIR